MCWYHSFLHPAGIWEKVALLCCVRLPCCWRHTIWTPNQWTGCQIHHGFFFWVNKFAFFKNICCHALNIYRCYTPGPLGEGFECNFDCWMFLAGWGLGIWNCSLHMHTVGLTLCSKWVFNMEEFEHVQTIGGLLGDLAEIGPSVLQIASLLPVSGPKIGG